MFWFYTRLWRLKFPCLKPYKQPWIIHESLILELVICFHAKALWKENYRMLWHPIMNHQDVLNWHWEHLVLGMFYYNEQETQKQRRHFSAPPHLRLSGWIDLSETRRGRCLICIFWSIIKALPGFLEAHMHGHTRAYALRTTCVCSDVGGKHAHFDVHRREQKYMFTAWKLLHCLHFLWI